MSSSLTVAMSLGRISERVSFHWNPWRRAKGAREIGGPVKTVCSIGRLI